MHLWILSGDLLDTTAFLSVVPFVPLLLSAVALSVYSFIVSYSLLNRLAV